MKIINSLDISHEFSTPVVLTIGNFEGVHLGHQALLQIMIARKKKRESIVVITFENHPKTVFAPDTPTLRLTTLDHKLQLLSAYGVDATVLLPFTKDLAAKTYQEFLQQVQSAIPFRHLVLGKGATMGKNREGNEENIKTFSQKASFSVEYVEKTMVEDQIISSNRIRSTITQGNLEQAAKLLGRPLSYLITPDKIPEPFGKNMQYVNFLAENLIAPPSGIYHGLVKSREGMIKPVVVDIHGDQCACAFTIYFHGKISHDEIFVMLPFPQEREAQSDNIIDKVPQIFNE